MNERAVSLKMVVQFITDCILNMTYDLPYAGSFHFSSSDPSLRDEFMTKKWIPGFP